MYGVYEVYEAYEVCAMYEVYGVREAHEAHKVYAATQYFLLSSTCVHWFSIGGGGRKSLYSDLERGPCSLAPCPLETRIRS